MKKPIAIILGAGLFVAVFLVGQWSGRRAAPVHPAASGQASPAQAEPGFGEAGESSHPAGTVVISAQRQQMAGLSIGTVQKTRVSQTLRVLGRVAADETRQYLINAATNGWIVDISSATPGTFVKKGDVLAAFYAPELLGAQQALIYGLNGMDRAKENAATIPAQVDAAQINVTQYRDALRNLGMGEKQIDEIVRTRERVQRVDMASPASGIVVFRNIYKGLKFIQGQEFFRIADLSRIWVLLDIFENEADDLRPGMKARVRVPNQGKEFEAAVSTALPLFDSATRTLKVRLEADNPGYALRPDMFVDVEVPVEIPDAIAVPADAVLDSGLKKTVFVALEGGTFEPREVETGRRLGGVVEITKGLMPGERIVTSGTFLVDSESRMETALSGMTGTLAEDPVCGMSVSLAKAEKAGRKSVVADKTYYFCSDKCKALFDASPSKYTDKATKPEAPAPDKHEGARTGRSGEGIGHSSSENRGR